MRLRTISETIEHLKKEDPGCSFTATALRRMIVSGEIPSTRIGIKYLIDIDRLENYLFPPEKPKAVGHIRPVEVRR